MTPARAPARGRAKCGAKTRSGTPCQAPAVKGKTRCRQHGGSLPGAPATNQRAKKHGIYGTHFTPDEIAELDDIRARVGSLDAEIELMRMRIRRALNAEARAAVNEHNGLELQKFVDKQATEFTAGPEHVYERVDYNAHIERLVRRIESLERTRAELLEAEAKRRENEDPDGDEAPRWEITIVSGKER
ncbi:HGGxSTG domain-containing protein [Burkholderia pyrrocinia]|uniref:HGGxSTG domain-containing protein n=1 Tax=Burkholderia pyrrocinia TaxID=60550 RepID=UPI0024BFBC31|nr:HGGxSTG domain-containing protein [Burkholderia pyrrocinia]